MRLLLGTAIAMVAFAANSVLTRVGVAQFGMDPFVFAAIRVAAGAVMLAVLVGLSGKNPFDGISTRWRGSLALATYMIGFSYGYLTVGAGLGALILFGTLQVFMFGWAASQRVFILPSRWIGVTIALVGLVILLWPRGTDTVSVTGALMMVIAAAGWGAYTILGQGARDPLGATAGNFVLCLPLVALPLLWGTDSAIQFEGIAVAIAAGAITSGLGYAVWYAVLPQLPVTVAAIAQLSVPVIAVSAGVVLLGEAMSPRLLVAGGLVLGGIGLSTLRWAPKRRN